MRVELLVNLKTDKIWRKGEVLESPLPPDIQKEVDLETGAVRVLEDVAEKPNAVSETVNEKPKPPDDKPAEKIEVQDQPIDDGVKAEKLDALIEKIRYPKLDALIKLKGSVAETARSLGVSVTTVSNWRKGKTKPKKSMIAKISRMVRNDENRADDTGDSGSKGPE